MISHAWNFAAADERGFSLVEMLVSVAIMLAVTGGIFQLLNPAQSTFQAQPEMSDLQQRLRVSIDTLHKDLLMAGAGSYMGSQAGSLSNFFAPVLPFRQGRVSPDPVGTFKSDTITLLFVPPTVAQTTIANEMPASSAELKVTQSPGCPATDPLCGFENDMNVLIYDDTGSYDTFTITNVQDGSLHLQHNLDDVSKSYPGPPNAAKITQIAAATYYLNTSTNQLMKYDNAATETPVADNVVGLNFEYYGEPMAPAMARPGTDLSVTYGPKPPSLAAKIGNWPLGENCTIKVVGGQQVPRLPDLGAPGSALVKLTAAQLTDGPWCPDDLNPNRWDADLIRIRKVLVTVRVQAAVAALRGSAGTWFKNAGTATRSNQTIPDQEIKFDVTPRNLNLGR